MGFIAPVAVIIKRDPRYRIHHDEEVLRDPEFNHPIFNTEENMHTTRSPFALFVSLVSLGIFTVIIMTSCQPDRIETSSPEPVTTPLTGKCDPITASNDIGMTILTLPDGSLIYLAESTEIEFTPAGYCQGVDEHRILLNQGQVAIHSLLPEGKWTVVRSPDGYLAKVGDTGLVSFDPEGRGFTLACTNGSCALGVNVDTLTLLGCGESAELDATGNFIGPFNVDTDSLVQFGQWLQPKCAPAQTSTPKSPTNTLIPATETLDAAATATASCASFHRQFPLTPCPPNKP
jgi:hypothetical protein